MDISFLLFPNLLPQAQNFPLHLGVRQDQFHSIVRHQFLFPKEDNTPLNLSSFFTTSILPSFFSFNFYISYFIISSNLSKNLDRKRSAIFSRLRPAFLPPGRPGMGSPAGSPLPRWSQRISFVRYDLVGVGMITITPTHSVCFTGLPA